MSVSKRQGRAGAGLASSVIGALGLKSLRTTVILFAIMLPAVVLILSGVGWGLSEGARGVTVSATRTVDAVLSDFEVLRLIKTMQIDVLTMQTTVSSLATEDPDDAANDIRERGRDYRRSLKTVTRILVDRHITAVGAIHDVGDRLALAGSLFDGLVATIKAAEQAQSAGGNGANALVVKADAQVDGLYEHLDRLAEGLGLIVTDDKRGLDRANAKNTASMNLSIRIMGGVALFGLCFCIASVHFLLRGVLSPLLALVSATKRLAAGDLATPVPAQRTRELDEMGTALSVFRDNLAETERLRRDQERREETMQAEKRQLLERLATEFEAKVAVVVDQVGLAVDRLRRNAEGLAETADGTLNRSAVVSSASEEASANVRNVAGSAEELSRAITEISRQMTNATDISDQAMAEARTTDEAVVRLGGAAQGIGNVVEIIRKIARQTNLLALNATIEAARAGEAGRGFAIVANEVKQLAGQTASATGRIEAEVNAIQSESAAAARAIEGIVRTVGRISEITVLVASAVEEQGAATAEITRSVQSASDGARSVSQNIMMVTEAAGETRGAAGELLDAAGALARQAEQLRSEVSDFTSAVRAA